MPLVIPFGATKAGLVLANILANDPKIRRKVSTLYFEYKRGLRAVEDLEPDFIRRRLYRLWLDDHLLKTRAFPDKVGSYLANVLRAAYREQLLKEKPGGLIPVI